VLEIHFYDKAGIDLAPWIEKKVERLYFRGEFRRAFFEEVGEIIYPPRALEYYTAGLMDALDGNALIRRRPTIVVDMGMSPASFVLPQVAGRWDIEMVALRPFVDSEQTRAGGVGVDSMVDQMTRSVAVFQADFGLAMDATAERISLVTGSGRVLDSDTTLHVMTYLWSRTDSSGLCMAVPLTASRVVELIAVCSSWIACPDCLSARK